MVYSAVFVDNHQFKEGDMPQSALDKQVRKAVRSVARRNIIGHMEAVFKHYRTKTKTQQSQDSKVRTTYLTLNIRGVETHFLMTVGLLGSPQQSQVTAEVTYGGKEMLYLVRYCAGVQPPSNSIDPRLIVRRKDGSTLVVHTFRSGCWMEGLNLKRTIRDEERLKRQQEKAKEAAARPRNPVLPREDDYRIGQRFGLN